MRRDMDLGDWIVGGILIAVAGAAVVWVLRQRQGPDQEEKQADTIGPVVIDAFAAEWNTRFGWTSSELRAMVASGDDSALRRRVDSEVGLVDLKFDGSAPGQAVVDVTVIVNYAHEGARSTASMALPWDSVPDDVRADILRAPGSVAFRKWRAVQSRNGAAASAGSERSST